MNKNRRQLLKSGVKRLEDLKGNLEEILSEEEEYFDMMPENLQGSINGMNSEEAIDKMNDAIVCLEEAAEAVEEIL